MALKQRHNEPDETAATTQRRVETATVTKTTGKINKTSGFEIQTNGTRTPLSQRKLNSLQEEFKGIFYSAKSVQIMAIFIFTNCAIHHPLTESQYNNLSVFVLFIVNSCACLLLLSPFSFRRPHSVY